MNTADFVLRLENIYNEAQAGTSENPNPLLTYVRLIFTDDSPNSNGQGVSQSEFPSLISSMRYMPIKANYTGELNGHDGAYQIGVITEGQQEGNKIVAIGALYNDEYPEVVDYFKKSVAGGNQINFSWELRYKNSETDSNGVQWLSSVITKAITAVKNPAYEGKTPLVTIGSVDDFMLAIQKELRERDKMEV